VKAALNGQSSMSHAGSSDDCSAARLNPESTNTFR
jgi:hypothetical protein